MKKEKSKEPQSILDNLYLAAPCPMTWESMQGDDKVRNCSGCAKNVYNISAMTTKEAEEFLNINGDSACLRFFRRADGTVITDECPVGLRKLRDRMKAVAQVAASFIAFVVSIPIALAQGTNSSTQNTNGGTTQGSSMFVKPTHALGGKPVMPTPPGTAILVTPKDGSLNDLPQTIKTGDGKVGKDGKAGGGKVGADGKVTGQTGSSDKTWIKLNAQHETFADTKAVEFYKKAKAKEEEKNYQLAEFFYEKALDAVEKQGRCDSKFRTLIEGQLANVRKLSAKVK